MTTPNTTAPAPNGTETAESESSVAPGFDPVKFESDQSRATATALDWLFGAMERPRKEAQEDDAD